MLKHFFLFKACSHLDLKEISIYDHNDIKIDRDAFVYVFKNHPPKFVVIKSKGTSKTNPINVRVNATSSNSNSNETNPNSSCRQIHPVCSCRLGFVDLFLNTPFSRHLRFLYLLIRNIFCNHSQFRTNLRIHRNWKLVIRLLWNRKNVKRKHSIKFAGRDFIHHKMENLPQTAWVPRQVCCHLVDDPVHFIAWKPSILF